MDQVHQTIVVLNERSAVLILNDGAVFVSAEDRHYNRQIYSGCSVRGHSRGRTQIELVDREALISLMERLQIGVEPETVTVYTVKQAFFDLYPTV